MNTRLAVRTIAGIIGCIGMALSAAPALADSAAFGFTATEQSFVVPAAVHSVTITAIGGRGGNSVGAPTNSTGGRGAHVSGTLSVTPGQTLFVEVGGNGGNGGASTAGAGGFNGGGAGGQHGSSDPSYNAGGGGGGSDVRTVAANQPGSLTSRLLVAAGAGGAGAYAEMDTGGDADGAGNCGGNAGTSTSGGAAPDDTASAGTLGQGGHGGGDGSFGGFPGGGGGGGLYGGGGGDGGYTGSSCGGGGGSSMGDTVTLDDTAIPKITIAWTPVPEASVSPSFLAFATQTVGTASSSQTVTVTNSGSAPLTISGTSVSGNNPADFAVSSGCPGNVAPQSSCSLTVAFTPGDTGTRSASLVLNTNASSSPSNVALAGSGAAVSAGPPPAIRAPGLSALRLRPAAFRAALRGPSLLSATSRGAALSWTDTSASTVTFAVLRSVKGIRSGSRCVARPRKPRHGAKSCTRLVAVGSFTATDVAGANSRRFSGRVKGHALKPGSYVLRLVAVANGLKSAAVQTKFRIVR